MFDHDPYPPLISGRSPSYERASREFLHPTSTGPAQAIAVLSRLSEAEHNASQVCLRAASLLSDPAFRTRVHNDASVHEERRDALSKLILAMGGSPPTIQECRDILAGGLDAVAQAHSDVAAQGALRTMRRRLSAEYDDAIRTPDMSEAHRVALANLAPSLTDTTGPAAETG